MEPSNPTYDGAPIEPERIHRASSPELDAILGIALPVLDKGFIRVIDYMGDDAAIVQAARVSYGQGTKKAQDDRNLIRYLMRHLHTTPFEMCEIKLHVRVPMDAWRQWIRHRTANVNEYSTRYSIAIDACQTTQPDAWRTQHQTEKQGSAELLPIAAGQELSNEEAEIHRLSRQVYQHRITAGVAREQARKDLPLSTYTEAYWKIDLHNLLHFLALRMDSHAQAEIRSYATIIGNAIVKRWCPEVWNAFLDYRLNSLRLSQIEVQVITAINHSRPDAAMLIARDAGWVREAGSPRARNRERSECEDKLLLLGLPVPWADAPGE